MLFITKAKKENAIWKMRMARMCLNGARSDSGKSAELAYKAMCLYEQAAKDLGYSSASEMTKKRYAH